MSKNEPMPEDVDQRIRDLLAILRRESLTDPLSTKRIRGRVVDILAFLSSADGRTDANCCAVGLALITDDELQSRIELIQSADPVVADVLRDMGGALHDTVSAAEVATNFESTPEQLLQRLAASNRS
jgi:hypothetical protein